MGHVPWAMPTTTAATRAITLAMATPMGHGRGPWARGHGPWPALPPGQMLTIMGTATVTATAIHDHGYIAEKSKMITIYGGQTDRYAIRTHRGTRAHGRAKIFSQHERPRPAPWS